MLFVGSAWPTGSISLQTLSSPAEVFPGHRRSCSGTQKKTAASTFDHRSSLASVLNACKMMPGQTVRLALLPIEETGQRPEQEALRSSSVNVADTNIAKAQPSRHRESHQSPRQAMLNHLDPHMVTSSSLCQEQEHQFHVSTQIQHKHAGDVPNLINCKRKTCMGCTRSRESLHLKAPAWKASKPDCPCAQKRFHDYLLPHSGRQCREWPQHENQAWNIYPSQLGGQNSPGKSRKSGDHMAPRMSESHR